MKRVLIFSTAYLPMIGGAEIAVKEITDRINDIQFDLITAKIKPGLPSFEHLGNVNIYRIGLGIKLDKFKLPIWAVIKAISLNKKNNYQLIWSVMASQASVAAALFKIIYPKKKLLLTLQEGDEEEHLKRYVFGNNFLYQRLIKPWHLLVFKKANHLTAISHFLKDRAVKNGVKVPIEIVANAVNVSHFSQKYSASQLNDLKNKLGMKEGEIYLITTSRLVLKNAVDDVIKSLVYLPNNIKFLILGIGPDETMLKNLAKELKVESRVKFLGQIDHRDLPKYLKISDIFIRPSLSEGLGNSFLEAMAAGIPVIGTPVGGIIDFLHDPSTGSGQAPTGLLCQVRNPQSIAEKIQLLINDNLLREKLIGNAKDLVEKYYDWNIIAEKMNNIFNKLVD